MVTNTSIFILASKYIVRTRHSDPYQSRHAIYFAAVLLVRNPRSDSSDSTADVVLPRKNILL
jgi:hypothetical protein